jgi:DNA-binding transcriptional LysR family regulator
MLNETDLSRIDLNLLVLFDVVMSERHVGRTARRLNLSPSAISHGLGRLRRLFDDPLFLRTPRGVVPNERAEELRAPVADALSALRSILTPAEAFDPTRSERRFVVGAPDGVSAVLLPALLARMRAERSTVRIGFVELLPDPGALEPDLAWRSSFEALEARSLDVAVVPATPPARFRAEQLYREDFVLAVGAKHHLACGMSLDEYCLAEHVLVSRSADAIGFVDARLAAQGRARTLTLTVPNALLALATVSETDMIAALPRRLVSLHGEHFGVVALEPPFELGSFEMIAAVAQGAEADRGIAWLLSMLRGHRAGPAPDTASDQTA